MRTSNLGPLIAILSSSVLSFIASQYLPYVITAFSGTIAAVPLAIFTVSAVVALVSVIYLVKLIISKADNKKEAGPSKEEPDQQIEPKQPTKELAGGFVHENSTNLESKSTGEESNKLVKQNSGTQTEFDGNTNIKNESGIHTPAQSPITLGTAIPQTGAAASQSPHSAAPPPPPPPPPPVIQIDPLAALRNTKKNKTGSSSGPKNKANSQIDLWSDVNKELKDLLQKRKASKKDDTRKQDPEKLSATPKSNEDNANQKIREELAAKIEREQAERKRQRQSGPADIAPALAKRKKIIKNPDSESEHSDGSSGCSTDEGESKRKETKQKKRTKRRKKSTPSNPQPGSKTRSESPDNDHISSDNENRNASQGTVVQASSGSQLGHRERSGSSDGGYISGNNVELKPISPLHSAPEVEEPSLPLKPANLHTRPKSPLIEKENGTGLTSSKLEEPSALSFKERAKLFENYR
ncbi:TAF4-like domain-containing protein [Wolbachia endosymbiont of Cimex lectularius]|uniref:hypothetical protein n=1 Tax=Wolbachia endosymbiont of Cimex lectularius TaxID=246273 RepID=UPI00049AF714|nr:hypothetical protein [Wolbachia endosymbiont of Cimex lectularius]BAP00495.1 WAS family protein [Wolbachia endosymbiont of Cimex lectularius]